MYTHICGKLILVWLKSNLRPFSYNQTCLSVPDISAEPILTWVEHYCSQELLYNWLRMLSETSPKNVLGCKIVILSHVIALPASWPMVCDFFTSLLCIYYFFLCFTFFGDISLWISSPESSYSPSKIFSNQVNIEGKLRKDITKWRYFILFSISGGKGLGKKRKVTYVKR